MKTIIASLLLLICFNVFSQTTITKERIRLTAYSPNMDLNEREQCRVNDSIRSILFKDIPQSEINLGLHKFGEQHRTGNHLIIIGVIATTIGGLLISDSYKYLNTSNSFSPGVVFSVAGGGLTTAGLIVNLNSFRYLR